MKKILVPCLLALVLAAGRNFAVAQDEPTAPAASETKKPAPKKITGRLPNYFSSVVTSSQRQEIYGLQAKYNSQIELLQKQIAELIAERDEAVDGVLSEEQLAEVNKKREAAKARRASRSRRSVESTSSE